MSSWNDFERREAIRRELDAMHAQMDASRRAKERAEAASASALLPRAFGILSMLLLLYVAYAKHVHFGTALARTIGIFHD